MRKRPCSSENNPAQVTLHVKGLSALVYMLCNIICHHTAVLDYSNGLYV